MPDKLQAIRDWPTPHCLRDVRAFVGLASYYRRFVRNFASIAEPLTRLTKKNNTPFKWTDDADRAFRQLKDALAFPIPGTPCILDTDASDVAVGAVLSQIIDGVERPIAFYSRVMNSAQRNYCPTRPLLRQQKRKLQRLWSGPWRIIKFQSSLVVVIQNLKTNKHQTVHVDRLAPCRSQQNSYSSE